MVRQQGQDGRRQSRVRAAGDYPGLKDSRVSLLLFDQTELLCRCCLGFAGIKAAKAGVGDPTCGEGEV